MVLRLSFRQGRAGRRQSTVGKVGRLSGTSLSKPNPGRTGSIIGLDARWTDRFPFAASGGVSSGNSKSVACTEADSKGTTQGSAASVQPAPCDHTPPAPLFPPRDAAARRKESLRAAQDRTKPGEGAEKAPLEVSMTKRDFRRESARKTPQLPSWRKRPVPPSSQDPTPIRFGPRGLQFLLFPLRP